MPGVRRASRGCNTCKRRKVLATGTAFHCVLFLSFVVSAIIADVSTVYLQRPKCGRCIRAGIRCEGYDKTATFINRDASNIKTSGRKTLAKAFKDASKERKRSPPGRHPCSGNRESSLSCSSPRSSEGSLNFERQSPRATFEDAPREATVSTSLKDLQILRNTSNSRGPMLDLMDRYYVADGSALHQAKLYTAISGLLNPTEIFDFAISATVLTRCGQVNHDDRVVYQGTAQYVKAITSLQKCIKDPCLVYEDETLAVSLLLSAYELINGTEQSLTPWLTHMDRVSGLILMRGPERHQIGLAHNIFLHYRASSALRAVMTRKRSFLSLPNWLTTPFEINPKDIFHHLLDLVFELCSILEAFDKEKESFSPNSGVLFGLALDCQNLYARFEEWFENMKALYPGPLYTLIPAYTFAPEDESPSGPVFTSFLDFPDLAIAQTVVNFWGSFLVLQTTAGSISQALKAAGTIIQPSSPDAAEGCTTLALLIAQSVPYCLQERFKTAGPMVALHTFSSATQWFEHLQAEREIRWCREVFAKMNAGGNPFEDPDPGDRIRNDAIRAVMGEVKSEIETAKYHLSLPHYGKNALQLDV